MDWSRYPNFTEAEFKCKHCGKVNMNPLFMDKLQELRNHYGKPLIVSSGYRCKDHPSEANKTSPGAHSMGIAVDLAVQGTDAYKVLKLAFALGFTGVGVNQKSDGRFVHLDTLDKSPRPNVWSY